MPETREIPLVLVTGAGASRDFGLNGQQLPLMAEWADLLVRKLADSALDFHDATGLKPQMSGPDFEQALGRFLRNTEAFDRIKEFVPLTYRFANDPGSASEVQLKSWYGNAKAQLDRIISVLHSTLIDQFGAWKVSGEGAAAAYGELLKLLHVPAKGIVYATTNYDPLGELALNRLGGRPDSGEAEAMPGIPRGPLDVAGLLGGLASRSPVLHLHGKVGWYRQADGTVESRDVTQHDAGHGVPVVMLPDPEKTYASDAVLALLWAQFEAALGKAKRTLVLGHSLNDALLVKALKEHIAHQWRLGITLLANEQGEFDPAELDALKALFGDGPKYIPLHFGRKVYGRKDLLEQWAQESSGE
jgi:hypothetical protein